jgi:hypothetical protein
MTYQVKNFSQSTIYNVADGSANTNAVSVTFLGKSETNYGTYLNQNFLWLTENFSSPYNSPPQLAVQGQLWWDSTYKFLNVYDGTNWNTLYGNLSTLNVNSAINASTINAAIINSNIFTANAVYGSTIGNTNTKLVGYITTNAQPYINSLGTLNGLVVNGSIQANVVQAGYIGNSGALLTGTLTTALQPNITSVGTLTSLTTSGVINTSNNNISVGTANIYGAYSVANIGFVGLVLTNAQPYITSVGTLTSLTTSGSIDAGTGNIYGAYHIANSGMVGLITTNSQPYITTVGTLTGLTVSGTASLGNVITTNGVYYPNGLAFTTGGGTTYSNSNVASYLPTYTGTFGTLSGITTSGAILPSSNTSINLGSTSSYWNNVYAVNFLGTSTTAKYADLAEKYLPDDTYEVGTVMMIGGTKEITQHNGSRVRALGVISKYPAYMMNSEQENGVYVALKGRVPVKVVGPVTKGQALIGTAHGLAIAQTDDSQWMFGISLEDHDDNTIKLIEAVIL